MLDLEHGCLGDGTAQTPTKVSFVVTAVNDAPTIAPRTITLDEDTQVVVDLLTGAADVDAPQEVPLGDGDVLSVIITAGPQHGALTQNPDGITVV